MNELKAYKMVNEMYCTDVRVIPAEVYFKSEADKVIARHKYKRCLAMARCCNRMFSSTFGKERYWQKWNRRWLELAEEPTWAKFLQLIHKETK